MPNCLITEEQLNFLLDNGAACIKEEKGGIDIRMKVLAELIYDKSLEYSAENKASFIISAQDLNRFQDYIVFSEPLRIIIGQLKGASSAAYNFVNGKDVIYLDITKFRSKDFAIPLILHELTHMVHHGKTGNTGIFQFTSKNNPKDIAKINRYMYYFNSDEMQARICQYYYYCQLNTPLPPLSPDMDKITNIINIKRAIKDVKNNLNIAVLFSCALRRSFGKKPMDAGNFMKNGHSSLISYMEKRYQIYLGKLMKIYKHFSSQKLS